MSISHTALHLLTHVLDARPRGLRGSGRREMFIRRKAWHWSTSKLPGPKSRAVASPDGGRAHLKMSVACAAPDSLREARRLCCACARGAARQRREKRGGCGNARRRVSACPARRSSAAAARRSACGVATAVRVRVALRARGSLRRGYATLRCWALAKPKSVQLTSLLLFATQPCAQAWPLAASRPAGCDTLVSARGVCAGAHRAPRRCPAAPAAARPACFAFSGAHRLAGARCGIRRRRIRAHGGPAADAGRARRPFRPCAANHPLSRSRPR